MTFTEHIALHVHHRNIVALCYWQRYPNESQEQSAASASMWMMSAPGDNQALAVAVRWLPQSEIRGQRNVSMGRPLDVPAAGRVSVPVLWTTEPTLKQIGDVAIFVQGEKYATRFVEEENHPSV